MEEVLIILRVFNEFPWEVRENFLFLTFCGFVLEGFRISQGTLLSPPSSETVRGLRTKEFEEKEGKEFKLPR